MNNHILLTPETFTKEFSNTMPVNKPARSEAQNKASPIEASHQENRHFKDDMKRIAKETDGPASPERAPKDDGANVVPVSHSSHEKPPKNNLTEQSEELISKDSLLEAPDTTAFVQLDSTPPLSQLDVSHSPPETVSNPTIEAAEAVLPVSLQLNHSQTLSGEGVDGFIPASIEPLSAQSKESPSVTQPLVHTGRFVNTQDGAPVVSTATSIQNQNMAKSAEISQSAAMHIPSAVKMVEKLVVEKAPVATTSWAANSSVVAEASSMPQLLDQVSTAPVTPATIAQPITPATSSPITQLTVSTPVQQAQWGEAVAEKVMWMSSKGIKEADIQLDPPELGPLTVKVSMSQEQAHVSFTVQHGSVREALDQSAMRLREMFAEEGINLADVDVSEHSQSDEQASDSDQFASDQDNPEYSDVTETPISSASQNYNLIDSYV